MAVAMEIAAEAGIILASAGRYRRAGCRSLRDRSINVGAQDDFQVLGTLDMVAKQCMPLQTAFVGYQSVSV